MKNEEADNNGLDEKEDGEDLMIAPTPPSTRVMPKTRMIEIRTERYSKALIGEEMFDV
jgi:hypothetical protein